MITSLLLASLLLGPGPIGHSLKDFTSPPASARPWVYWYFMDGNLSREGMTADLEAMKSAGIGGAIFLEVDLGIPRGPVKFMSKPWQDLVRHAVKEADRLGIEIALGTGPGWCGTGGPWVKPEQSMQHLVSSETSAVGPSTFDAELPRPKPRTPFFGEWTLTDDLAKEWAGFYKDECVLAFPTPDNDARITDVDEKALYFRAPYSSQPGVKSALSPAPPESSSDKNAGFAHSSQVIDVTRRMQPDGRLTWTVPPGKWTIARFGRTITGQVTRPAPEPGLGFETDKFSKTALDAHFSEFSGKLSNLIGPASGPGRGLTTLHFDSWEMSSQNWTVAFRTEFTRRRGYDPLPFLPAMTGHIVDSTATSERFLWDLRRTAQELVVENHVDHLRDLAHQRGLKLSIEPYDMNPAGDLDLGSAADVPMCEFWADGYGLHSEYSVMEAVSLGHVLGKNIVGAESFTANAGEDWRLYPGAMKNQADWALCAGINRIVFHRYQHQPWLDRRPGMTMGPYGVHWERTQTWWDMSSGFHTYLARCQAMMRRGKPVADILYLTPEGAPNVFQAPSSATTYGLPDRRAYNFDACSADQLVKLAKVRNGRIVFPSGMSYQVLVLPRVESMTPELIHKLGRLVSSGATIIGSPPNRSPSLVGYPKCDAEVASAATRIWKNPRVVRDNGVQAKPEPHPLSHARWIWAAEGDPRTASPVGQRTFHRTVNIRSVHDLAAAKLVVTADNSFVASINGQAVAQGNDFKRTYGADIRGKLRSGANDIEIVASNDGDSPNPAGMICAVLMRTRDGKATHIVSDSSWRCTTGPMSDLGSWEIAPWYKDQDSDARPEMFPSFEQTVTVLKRLKVVPDFESNSDLRYAHRSDGQDEIYFVANRSESAVNSECRFRVVGRHPEIWDTVTGQRHSVPNFRVEAGQTVVQLTFAPSQSWFVVFRPGTSGPRVNHTSAASYSAQELKGPWNVSFDPTWGGPKFVSFERLVDWTSRSEAGIRNYSGKAIYRQTFNAPKPKAFTHIGLGDVAVMASVRLNGHDLGVAWCAPWQLSIPSGLLRAKGNKLEVTVANLWCNRLIADSGLPEKDRLTWTTRNPFRPGDKLLRSGLIGPVRLLSGPMQ